MMRGAKRDATEHAVVDALEKDGWVVTPVNDPGVPDLLCSRHGLWLVLEVKSPGGSLTPRQKEFIKRHKAPVWIVHSPEEALEVARVLSPAISDPAPWPPVNAWDAAHQLQAAEPPVLQAGKEGIP